jgi:hypothetical protein
MLGTTIPLLMYIDSKSLFDVVTRGPMRAERRLPIDIAFAREGFDRGWISELALVPSEWNLADGSAKPNATVWLFDFLQSASLGELDSHVRQWIVRLDSTIKVRSNEGECFQTYLCIRSHYTSTYGIHTCTLLVNNLQTSSWYL